MNLTRLLLLSCPLVAACASSPAQDPYAGAETTATDGPADSAAAIGASRVTELDLVSDRPGAATQDVNLGNPWGLAFNPAGPAWVANNHSGTSTVYDATGALKLTVTLPAAAGSTDPASPTGEVTNAIKNDFSGDLFIFDGEDGRVYAWQPTTGVTVRNDRSATSAVYKGLAIATDDAGVQHLYLADFHNGAIAVLDTDYQPVTVAPGAFHDPKIPTGYAPFNVQELGGNLFVTYAKQDANKHDDVSGAGNGYVNEFTPDGAFLRRVISRGDLNSPWGLAIAPASWGALAGDLLVGNQGNGRIHVYDINASGGYGGPTVKSHGALASGNRTLSVDGLWALAVGPDGHVYFSAGPNDEANGLFGQLNR